MKRHRCLVIAPVAFLALILAGNPASGNHFEPLPAYADAKSLREDSSLHAVEFVDVNTGIAVGDRGAIVRTTDGGATWKVMPSGVTCRLLDVRFMNRNKVFAIGGRYDRVTQISRGVVLKSEDAGETWQRAGDQELPMLKKFTTRKQSHRDGPHELSATGDFSCSALASDFISAGKGSAWQGNHDPARKQLTITHPFPDDLRDFVDATGKSLVLRDTAIVLDQPQNWWAVGDHGVIVHSADRGTTWKTRRGNDRHCAVLMVSSAADRIAFPLVGAEAFEHRNRVSVLVSDQDKVPLDLVRQAVVMLGGAGADRIGRDPQAPSDWLALQKPVVVLLDDQLSETTKNAFQEAAIQSGVQRVLSYSFDSGGESMIHRAAILPKRGVLMSDLSDDALMLLCPEKTPPQSIGIQRLYDATGVWIQGESIASGLRVPAGAKLTAEPRQATRRQLQVVQGRMSRPKLLQQLFLRSESAADFALALETMLDQTAKEDRPRLAWSVLLSIAELEGSQDRRLSLTPAVLHQAALKVIAERFAATSLGKWAAMRLDAVQNSTEWHMLRSALGQHLQNRISNSGAQSVAVSPFQIEVEQVGAVSPIVVPEVNQYELTKGKETGAVVDLSWEFHPLTLVSREAARHRGDEGPLQETGTGSANIARLIESRELPSWRALLRNDSTEIIVAHQTSSPPRLDGILDDACWETALRRPNQSRSLQMSYDDEYLYVAVQLKASDFGTDTTTIEPTRRNRDHDLRSVDRWQLKLDTDLDLLTSMQLSLSRAKRTHDCIDGFAAWDPEWYLQIRETEETVTIEAAVLRRDVTDLPIHRGQSWFVQSLIRKADSGIAPPPMTDAARWHRVVFR